MPSPSPVAPLDLFGVDRLLTDEERDVSAVVARFCADRIAPSIADWYDRAALPARELMVELGTLGVLGMHLDGYGCGGMNAMSYGLACLELESADSGIRSMVSVQGSLAMYAIHAFGSDEHKNEWLPRMARGEAIGCFGLTEADFGSDPGGMRTAARRDGDDWVLDGTKMWITNGSVADVAIVWARADDAIRGFVVPTDSPGFSARAIENKLSMRASVTSELVLDGVRLPARAMLPGARGLSGPLRCLSEARFGIVFGALGAARQCLETAIGYAADRTVFGRPLAGYQLTQRKLADMTLMLGTGVLLAIQLARLKEAGELRPEQVSVGKLNNVRAAMGIARECRTILGASGITLDYPVLRHAANLESVMTYEGTDEVHTLVIGQALTGLSAFH